MARSELDSPPPSDSVQVFSKKLGKFNILEIVVEPNGTVINRIKLSPEGEVRQKEEDAKLPHYDYGLATGYRH